MSMGKSRLGRQSPYQDDLVAPPRPKTSISGNSMVMSGAGTVVLVGVPTPDMHHGAREVARVERLLEGLGPADRVDDDVRAVAVGEFLHRLDHVALAGVDRVGGAELLGPLELLLVGVDRDDRRGA